MTKKITVKNLNGESYQVEAGELSFRPAVYSLIIKDGRVLLSRQWDGYCFPGGAIELDETIEEALKREVKEETGLEVEPLELIDCKDSFFQLPNRQRSVHSILIFYLCEIIGGNMSSSFLDEGEKESAKDPEWVDLSNIDNIKFMSTINCLEVIEKAKNI